MRDSEFYAQSKTWNATLGEPGIPPESNPAQTRNTHTKEEVGYE